METKRTLRIDGMMCEHCEKRVKKLLESQEEIDTATVSHTDGTAIITLNSEITDDKLKAIIEDDGYIFLG